MPASPPSATIAAAGAVHRRLAVSFTDTSRSRNPIGPNRNGRVTIDVIPQAADATATTEAHDSRFTGGTLAKELGCERGQPPRSDVRLPAGRPRPPLAPLH